MKLVLTLLLFAVYSAAFSQQNAWLSAGLSQQKIGTSGGGSGFTLIASNSVSTGTSGNVNTTGANLYVIFQDSYTTNSAAPTDGQGNTYAQATNVVFPANTWTAAWYCSNPTTSSTYHYTIANSQSHAWFSAWSGAASSGVVDTFAGAVQSANFTTMQPGSITPSTTGELLICGVAGVDTWTTMTIDSGFTIADGVAGYSPVVCGDSYLVDSASSAINPTWTFSGNQTGTTIIVAFKHQ